MSGPGSPGHDEEEVRREVQGLEDFAFADAVSTILAVALENAGDARQQPDYACGLRELAVLHASVRAYRAIRAGIGVLASGYALEAEIYTRVLLELFVSARAAHDDPTGTEAEQWLAGKRGKGISGRVRAEMHDKSVYGFLSQAGHGDPRALSRALLTESKGDRVVQWGPARTSQTEQQLVYLALAVRDFIVLLEHAGYPAPPEIEAIDRALQRKLPEWQPGTEVAPGDDAATSS